MVQSPKMRRMFSSELYDYTHSRGKCIHSLETSRRGYCGAGGAPPIHRLPPIGGAMNGWPIMYPTLPAPRPLPIVGGPGYKWTEDTRTALSPQIKQTIHKATFVAGDKATRSSVYAAHGISHGTFLQIDGQSISQRLVECSTHFSCTDDCVALLPVTKVASSIVCLICVLKLLK